MIFGRKSVFDFQASVVLFSFCGMFLEALKRFVNEILHSKSSENKPTKARCHSRKSGSSSLKFLFKLIQFLKELLEQLCIVMLTQILKLFLLNTFLLINFYWFQSFEDLDDTLLNWGPWHKNPVKVFNNRCLNCADKLLFPPSPKGYPRAIKWKRKVMALWYYYCKYYKKLAKISNAYTVIKQVIPHNKTRNICVNVGHPSPTAV